MIRIKKSQMSNTSRTDQKTVDRGHEASNCRVSNVWPVWRFSGSGGSQQLDTYSKIAKPIVNFIIYLLLLLSTVSLRFAQQLYRDNIVIVTDRHTSDRLLVDKA